MSSSYIDALFTFSTPLGGSYIGEWVRPDRFVVTAFETAGALPLIGSTTVAIASTDIRNAAGDAVSAFGQIVALQVLGNGLRRLRSGRQLTIHLAMSLVSAGVLTEPRVYNTTLY